MLKKLGGKQLSVPDGTPDIFFRTPERKFSSGSRGDNDTVMAAQILDENPGAAKTENYNDSAVLYSFRSKTGFQFIQPDAQFAGSDRFIPQVKKPSSFSPSPWVHP